MDPLGLLDVPLRGARDYVQGGDLYDGLCAAAARHLRADALEEPDLLVYRFLRSRPRVALRRGAAEKSPAAAAVLLFRHEGQPCTLVVQESGAPIEARIPCREARIVAAASLDRAASRAELRDLGEGTEVELAIALNKHLLRALFPDAGGKWLFTRYQADRYRGGVAGGAFAVRLEARLGLHLTRSAVEAGGRRLGSLFFSLAA